MISRRSAPPARALLYGGFALLAIAPSTALTQSPAADDGERLLTIDHFVGVRSTAPGMLGQPAQIHVRERTKAGTVLRGSDLSNRVVLFVHGGGTPAEVAFDTPYEDYSWMAYLASAGFDAFSMNVTGYGRSSRPPAMNDPCNLSPEQQELVRSRGVTALRCSSGEESAITTIASDWDDIGAVVDYIRALRGVESVSLVAWSQGGPRVGGYTARNPGKVDRLVLLAPAYNRAGPADRPASLGGGPVFNVQSRADFDANWDRQVGCADQYDPAVSDVVWGEMLNSDAVGSTWGPGVRRAPRTPTWGWNAQAVRDTTTPTLMIAPAYDRQVPPSRVVDLYEDLGSPDKILIDLGCASHNAHWERNHLLMFRSSLEWLTRGTVNGEKHGILRMGH